MLHTSLDLVACGGACKALDRGWLGGHLVLFGTSAQPDLSRKRDYFTSATDYDLTGCDHKSRVVYDHGLDPTLRKRRLAVGALGIDNAGVWIKAQLELRDEYEAGVYQLARLGKLGWSSGTANHLVERKAIEHEGELVHEVLSWPLGLDASPTPRPADPRGLVEVKSLALIEVPTLDEWLADPEIKAAVDAIRRDAGAGTTTYSFPAAGAAPRTIDPAAPYDATKTRFPDDTPMPSSRGCGCPACAARALAAVVQQGFGDDTQSDLGEDQYGYQNPSSAGVDSDPVADRTQPSGCRCGCGAAPGAGQQMPAAGPSTITDPAPTCVPPQSNVPSSTRGCSCGCTPVASGATLAPCGCGAQGDPSNGFAAKSGAADPAGAIVQAGPGQRTGFAACDELLLPHGMPDYAWPAWVLEKRGKDRSRIAGFVGDQAVMAGANPYDKRDPVPDGWGDLCLAFAMPGLDMLRKSGAESATYYGLGYAEFVKLVRVLFLCARARQLRAPNTNAAVPLAAKCAHCGGSMAAMGDAMKLTAEEILKAGASGGAGGAPIRIYCPNCHPPEPGSVPPYIRKLDGSEGRVMAKKDGVAGGVQSSATGTGSTAVGLAAGYDCSFIWNPAWGAQPTFTPGGLAVRGTVLANPYHTGDLLPEHWQQIAHASVRPSIDVLARRVWQLSYDQLEGLVENLYLCLRARAAHERELVQSPHDGRMEVKHLPERVRDINERLARLLPPP